MAAIGAAHRDSCLYTDSPLETRQERGRVDMTDPTASPAVARPRRPVPATSGDVDLKPLTLACVSVCSLLIASLSWWVEGSINYMHYRHPTLMVTIPANGHQ